MNRFIQSLILLLFFVQNAHAQVLEFRHISIDNGLSQNTVNSIAQDKNGIIWVGTLGGLNKFNGYDFTVFTHNERDSKSISHNRVNVVFIDKDGNVWIGTDDGLNFYNPSDDSFNHIPDAANQRYFVYCVTQDRAGNIWLGTAQGLKRLNRKKNRVEDVDLNITNINKRVQSIYEDDKGLLWIGLAKGFKIYDVSKQKAVQGPRNLQARLSSSWIQSIKQTKNNDFWFATENDGVFSYHQKENTILSYNKSNGILSNTVRDIFIKDDQHIWMATKMGLNILNLASGKITGHSYAPKLSLENSLSHPSVKCIFRDRSGNIWLGTYSGGINLIYNFSKIFSNKGIAQGDQEPFSNKEVNAILGDGNKKFWIATDGGGLNCWNKAVDNVEVYKYDNDNVLYHFIKDVAVDLLDSNKLWIGSSAGILVFDKNSKKFKEFKDIQKGLNVEFNHDYKFLNSKYGLWVATNYNGLHLIKNNIVVKSYTLANKKLVSNNISCLLLQGNNLWAGYLLSGLSRIELTTGRISSYAFDKKDLHSLSNNSVSCLFNDSKNRLWIGTNGGGINFFDEKTKRFYPINSQNGLANNTIHAIEEDSQGALWVSTNKGIFKILLKNNKFPLADKDIEVTNYTVLDGLQSNQFISGSSFKNKNGEIFFGGINGLSSFMPEKIAYNREIPNIIFTDFKILNREKVDLNDSVNQKMVDFQKEIVLQYDESYFTIKYAALNYIFPERNSYAYKLDGLSMDNWHYVKNQREVTYTGLEPGEYTFLVKAANNSGIWNNLPRQLKITVLPPWWKTNWAYLMYTLLGLVLLYLFNHYTKYTERLKNTIRYETELYQKEQELSQKKLSFIINISHEIKTPITIIMGPLQKLLKMHEGNTKTSNYLDLMNRSGQRLLNLVDQLLDLRKLDGHAVPLKAAKGNLVRFTKEIVIVFGGLAKSKNLELTFNAKKDKLELWFDRDKLEKILYNIISNAVKYTPDYGKIEVLVREDEIGKNAAIEIIDNGVGISQDRLPDLFQPFKPMDVSNNHIKGTGVGLAFAKELIELHHGRIEVESKEASIENRGYTKFSVKIPLGATYLGADELDNEYLVSEDISNYKSIAIKQQSSFRERKKAIKMANHNERFTMLLVEDNPDVIDFLADSFEDDFDIIKGFDGSTGLKEALERMPDIIISDVMMPVMDGIELCNKLKSNIITSHIPVVLLTARSPMIFKLEGLENGADEYVTKPFNFDLLEAKVWNLLENRQKMKLRYQKEITLQPTNTTISTFDDKFLASVMKYIEDNIAEESLNVEDLSSYIGMSRGNLYRKLKVLTSKSPVEFIRYIRLKRAAQLLKQHKMYINEVSYMVGFQNVTYFRKCFKEEFGYTPTGFAKTEEETEED
ncbi:hybrid sensor histidine kinase/response regulator transcription factor [Pedobacter jejuensis]|uniref:histidine kinase n=1 Tax=Pedobacter jejuensis TaxID=1268550 RepID=A0A3N0C124_9SPHI|nr:hybrid sensor histidine kinase/response regulator transcription factor [Pedobacter jejuensis]RNL55897.1 hybrid sensor histidine kinase/response regulator [Pedobacter jejuensis]